MEPDTADFEDDRPTFNEIELIAAPIEISLQASELLRDGRSRYKQIRSFGFVPSNYEIAWSTLNGLVRGSFCEWGCGLGIAVGLAELLGFEACGIEWEPELAESARELLRDHNLKAKILTGSYLDSRDAYDLHYVYCWPGEIANVERHFADIAKESSKLLIWYGQDHPKCKVPLR